MAIPAAGPGPFRFLQVFSSLPPTIKVTSFVLLASVILVLLGVISAGPLSQWLGRNAGWVLCLPLLAAAVLLMSAYIISPGGEVIEYYPWIPGLLEIGFHLRLNGLSLLFSLLVLLIGAGVLFYSPRYLGSTKLVSFYLTMSAFALAMLVLVLSNDLLVFYIAWEGTTFCSFFLIARSGPHAHQPAIRTLLVTVAGGLCLLAAVCVMTVAAGTTVITEVLASEIWTRPGITTSVVVLLAMAALTKSAQFPFQAWLPDSMVAISPVSAYLHAAAMVKAGVYLLLLFSPALAGHGLWTLLLVLLGTITCLFGAFGALRRYDLKELLAYSTMSQLGYLVMLIGVGTPLAITAAVLHTMAHALFKSALFLSVGIIDHQAGTRDMRMLASRDVNMPATLTVLTVAAASMAGLPPLFGFVSKETLFDALIETNLPGELHVALTVAIVVAAICTFAYSGRLVWGAFGNYRSPRGWLNTPRGSSADIRTVKDGKITFWIFPMIVSLAGVVLGLAPGLTDQLATAAVSEAVGSYTEVHSALWHGFTPALGLSVLVIIGGVIAVWKMPEIEAFLVPRGIPVSGLGVVEALREGLIDFGARVGAWTSGQNPGRHLIVPAVAVIALAVIGLFTLPGHLPDQVDGLDLPLDWALVLLTGVGVFATIRTQTRISALVVVGVVGFTTTLWFFNLGSVDVALTQLLIEILTVVVMVLLLKRLPQRFSTTSLRQALPAAIAALGAGGAAFLGVFALTGRRELSDVGSYYATEATEITGGDNIVNTILVEFRALDTLGELTVLGVAGIGVAALLASRKPDPVLQSAASSTSPLSHPHVNLAYLRSFTKIAVPVMMVLSLVTLVRGHNEPGGGFIAALLAGAGFSLLYLVASSDQRAPVRWPYITLIGTGVVVGVLTGIWGMLEGSFLTPLHADVFGLHLNTALIFDLGVYLAVLGLILMAFNLLGMDQPRDDGALGQQLPPPPDPHPTTGVLPSQRIRTESRSRQPDTDANPSHDRQVKR
ncbi:DUF4040 family protein [Auritidibacter ignavus]|nr:DUF4040 family protein [Auritidibacter ignavus]